MADVAPTKYAAVRDGFAAVRELLLVLAMLALFLAPATVREKLSEAGIRSFAGVEFDESTLQKVDQAGTSVAEIQQQIADVRQEFADITQNTTVRADPRFGTISKMLAEAQRKAMVTGENLDEAKDQQIDRMKRSGYIPRNTDLGSRIELDPSIIQNATLQPLTR